MKRIINLVIWAVVAVIASASCSDWTEMEPKFPTDLTTNINKDDYYANLRAYRNSEHEIMFGYYQGFGGGFVKLCTLADGSARQFGYRVNVGCRLRIQ